MRSIDALGEAFCSLVSSPLLHPRMDPDESSFEDGLQVCSVSTSKMISQRVGHCLKKLQGMRHFPLIPVSRMMSKECGITNIQDEEDYKKRVLENVKPVIVDFHASWCAPCKLLGPRLDKVMEKYMDKVLLAKVDIDKLETVSMDNGVSCAGGVLNFVFSAHVCESVCSVSTSKMISQRVGHCLKKLQGMRHFPLIPVSRMMSKECGITNIQDEEDYKKRVLENVKPVIVDFHASWCAPCKLLGPRLDKVMEKYMDKVLLAKVDIDKLETVSMDNGIVSVPTVFGIKDGKKVSEFVGLQTEDQINLFIRNLCE
ncbi:thioredoxin 2 [Sparganum proliferum]